MVVDSSDEHLVPDSMRVNESAATERQLATLAITGMTCSSCSGMIENVVSSMPGVLSIQVNLTTERATISYDPTHVGLRDIIAMITDVWSCRVTPRCRTKPSLHSILIESE